MATSAGGIPSPAGNGSSPQAHPAVLSRQPMVHAGDQKPHFVSPTGNVRPPHPGGVPGAAVPLLTRPLLGSPPTTGPSPLFPPQAPAAGSLPRPQAGVPHFSQSGPPATNAGAVFSRPPPPNGPLAARPPLAPGPPVLHLHSSQPPPHTAPLQILPPGAVQRPPLNFSRPPGLPPPQARPPISTPFPQPPTGNPPISVAPQVSGSGPLSNIIRHLTPSGHGTPPVGPPPPQFRPPYPPLAAGPPLLGGQNMLPPRGPPPPISVPPQQPPRVVRLPPEQSVGGLSIPPPVQFTPATSETSSSPQQAPSPTTPHVVQQPSSLSTPSPGPPPPQQQQPSPRNAISPSPSPKETAPPLLPSPQQQGELMMKGDVEDRGGELWFEHKLPDGRVYFSHPVTRKTTWDRPQNAQIKPHPAQQGPPPARSFPPGPTSPGGMPNASHLVPTRVWSEFQTPEGKPYFYNKITRASGWEKPTDFDLVMPLPPDLGAQPGGGAHQQMPHPRLPLHSPRPRLPLMSTPPMFQPGRPPFNPRFPPGPHPAMNQGLSPHVMEPRFPPPPPSHLLNTPPPSAGGPGPRGADGGRRESSGDAARDPEAMEVDKDASVGEATESGGGGATSSVESGAAAAAGEGETENETREAGASEYTETAQLEPEKEEPKGPRPTASVPVPGTPWMVVWTSDRRQFFFDVTSRVSLWIMPEELKDNPLVEKIIDDGPDGEAPSAKRVKVEGEGGEEEEDEMEGGELDISVGGEAVETMTMVQAEAVDAEKKAAMIRSGKTLEERQEEFKEMLLERGVSAFSTWDKELPKFVFDPRYMLLNSRERKSCFEEFIRSRAEEERKEKRSKLKAQRDEFRKLLEDSKLHPKSSFSEFAQRHARDERFKAVEKMREREQLFSDYLQELKKTAAAASSSTGRGRQRGGDRTAHDHTSSPHLKPTDKVKAEFMEMLSEDGSLTESSQWRKVKGGLERDPRYRAVSGGSSQREEWFLEYVKSSATGSTGKQAGTADHQSREREERIQASLKEREREVQMSRSAQEKEWGRERDQLRRSEALQQFKAMLADTIRSTGVPWNDARRQLRQDSRWASMGLLEADEKEKLYQEHCDSLVEKKRLQFRRLLEETSQISLVMPWKKARKLIREDPRYKNFSESDHRREAEYDKHLRDKMVMAKNEFRGLLKETKIVTYKSHRLVKESEKHYKEIVKVLENDQRYLVLECASEERDRILHDYMAELHRKGPPPPPTASNPSERLRKP